MSPAAASGYRSTPAIAIPAALPPVVRASAGATTRTTTAPARPTYLPATAGCRSQLATRTAAVSRPSVRGCAGATEARVCTTVPAGNSWRSITAGGSHACGVHHRWRWSLLGQQPVGAGHRSLGTEVAVDRCRRLQLVWSHRRRRRALLGRRRPPAVEPAERSQVGRGDRRRPARLWHHCRGSNPLLG